jgi:hypothetical protein
VLLLRFFISVERKRLLGNCCSFFLDLFSLGILFLSFFFYKDVVGTSFCKVTIVMTQPTLKQKFLIIHWFNMLLVIYG